MNHNLETEEELEYRIGLVMQGNDNFVRFFKKNEKKQSRDAKREKTREKDKRRDLRKLKEQELEE